MNQKIPTEVSQITKTLTGAGFSAYLVGGCVRDLLLANSPASEPKDWDITTSATPEQIIALFPKTFYENAFGTVTVVNEEIADLNLRHIEITPFRLETKYSDKRHPDEVKWSDKLADDLKRRDFTINAMAYDLEKDELIDLYLGQTDLKDKVIRAVGNPDERFQEDPLRMLRAIRLSAQLSSVIESDTAESIQRNATLLSVVSRERVRDEFVKLIQSPNPMIGLMFAHKLALLTQFLPELEEGLHVKQNGDHIFDVWEHSLRALQHAADRDFSLEVRLTALFHDIAKPRVRGWNEEKKDYTFYNHEVVGARMTKEILNRLKLSKKQIEKVVTLVRNHMFFTDIDRITLSAVRRIVANVGQEYIWELMNVRTSDRIGMGRPKEETYRLRKYQSMIEESLRAPTSVGMLKIDGQEVIRETGLVPSPKIGQILHALLNEVLENPDLNTKEFLIKKVKELAKLSDKELAKIGEMGKERKEKAEEEELKKIRSRYRVK
jgi:poly(A) polymerase/tRNA nucleotidyltransferase (CCA-adding enzyme)